nr:hypothetical protein [Tanacetum cinerariifolium]
MSPENKSHFQAEKEAIFLLLTGIGYELYSTVDACKTANEMWIAMERLQQAPKSQRSYAPAPKPSFSTRSNAPTRHKGKEIAKLIRPPFESGSDEDSDPEQKDKEMQNNFALIAKNQRTMTVVGARENVGSQAEQVDWIEDTDKEIYEHELEAHYSFVAKIQEDLPEDSNSNDTPLE